MMKQPEHASLWGIRRDRKRRKGWTDYCAEPETKTTCPVSPKFPLSPAPLSPSTSNSSCDSPRQEIEASGGVAMEVEEKRVCSVETQTKSTLVGEGEEKRICGMINPEDTCIRPLKDPPEKVVRKKKHNERFDMMTYLRAGPPLPNMPSWSEDHRRFLIARQMRVSNEPPVKLFCVREDQARERHSWPSWDSESDPDSDEEHGKCNQSGEYVEDHHARPTGSDSDSDETLLSLKEELRKIFPSCRLEMTELDRRLERGERFLMYDGQDSDELVITVDMKARCLRFEGSVDDGVSIVSPGFQMKSGVCELDKNGVLQETSNDEKVGTLNRDLCITLATGRAHESGILQAVSAEQRDAWVKGVQSLRTRFLDQTKPPPVTVTEVPEVTEEDSDEDITFHVVLGDDCDTEPDPRQTHHTHTHHTHHTAYTMQQPSCKETVRVEEWNQDSRKEKEVTSVESEAEPRKEVQTIVTSLPGKESLSDQLLLSNLPNSFTISQVQELVSTHGTLQSCSFVKVRLVGYALFTYVDAASTETACAKLNGLVFGQHKLICRRPGAITLDALLSLLNSEESGVLKSPEEIADAVSSNHGASTQTDPVMGTGDVPEWVQWAEAQQVVSFVSDASQSDLRDGSGKTACACTCTIL